MSLDTGPLVIPALRAIMGDWVYYVGVMKMRDIAARVKTVGEIHEAKSLQELLQRALQARSKKIADYLLQQPQRFFNSIVIGTYGGNPEWVELGFQPNRDIGVGDEVVQFNGILGFLRLDGTEVLFAIDGQHRVDGIRRALKKSSRLAEEEVSAIFVAGVSQRQRNADPSGFARTRRLFTTLNRYAKPVSKKDIIALDEDDAIAITTRRLVEEYPLFQGRISSKSGKNIPPTDRASFTTIETLYDVLDRYHITVRGLKPNAWGDLKRARPDERTLDDFWTQSVDFWDGIANNFEPIGALRSAPSEEIIPNYRTSTGGHLLYRPIGLLILVDVIRQLLRDGVLLADALQSLAQVPMLLEEQPWNGLLWNPVDANMITLPNRQTLAAQIIYRAVGGDLRKMRTSDDQLLLKLSGVHNRPVTLDELPVVALGT